MIKTIAAACAAMTLAAAPAHADKPHADKDIADGGLIAAKSAHDFDTTVEKLKAAIDKRGFTTFAVIDHAKGAASVGETLRPTTLIIFGNPRGGAPVMQAEQRMGLALPLKMLAAEDETGATRLYYANMAQVFADHGISDVTGPLGMMEGALAAIAAEASAP